MEADNTYQTSEAETEIDNSDDSNYETMTDETITKGQAIVRDSNISSSNDDKKLSRNRTPKSSHKFEQIHVTNKKYFITL